MRLGHRPVAGGGRCAPEPKVGCGQGAIELERSVVLRDSPTGIAARQRDIAQAHQRLGILAAAQIQRQLLFTLRVVKLFQVKIGGRQAVVQLRIIVVGLNCALEGRGG